MTGFEKLANQDLVVNGKIDTSFKILHPKFIFSLFCYFTLFYFDVTLLFFLKCWCALDCNLAPLYSVLHFQLRIRQSKYNTSTTDQLGDQI